MESSLSTFDHEPATITFDANGNRLLEPQDTENVVRQRVARLRALGLLGVERDEQFCADAKAIAEQFQAPVAVVNIFDHENQNFVGLYMPSIGEASTLKSMPKDVGWCPHTLARRKAFPLGNVMDYPRFAGNVLVDTMGAKSYLGAPLIDHTGTALGTVCLVDVVERKWGNPDVAMIKEFAGNVLKEIYKRNGLLLP